MPGLHGCKECCAGCQVRRCCCHPYMGWGDFFPHLCSHCRKLYKMILRAHAAELEEVSHARCRVRLTMSLRCDPCRLVIADAIASAESGPTRNGLTMLCPTAKMAGSSKAATLTTTTTMATATTTAT